MVLHLYVTMEVPKALGIISSSPHKGNYFSKYSFTPAVVTSLSYAINTNQDNFWQYAQIRRVIEESFFVDAAKLLSDSDVTELNQIVMSASEKMNMDPIQIPHIEHRQFHLKIYSQINNIFIKGILEGYWHVYEEFGLNIYSNLEYLHKVWDFHKRVVMAIQERDYSKAQFWLIAHMGLISQR